MFKLCSKYTPKGDQEASIRELTKNVNNGVKQQVLLGATGTGKTFTIANVIANTNRCAIIMVHNKTLAGQLYSEFKELFPHNHVEYFISYFDFFQPEAYKPSTDTYIEKNSKSNQEIEMLRLSTINSISSYDDVIIVASVAAIYASVSPNDFAELRIVLKKGHKFNVKQLCYDLVRLQYKRNDVESATGTFRLRGDILEIVPGYSDKFKIRISFIDDEIESIGVVDPLSGKLERYWDAFVVVPANEYVMNKTRMEEALSRITTELQNRIIHFKNEHKLLEAQRIEERTRHDMEAIRELGYCNGIENYSCHLELRQAGETPYTIFDFYKDKDWLLIIDESHMTLPQIRGMYNTDRSRKNTLVEYGFRLPSALDNRPLNFDEFQLKIKNAIYVSATPNDWEIEQSHGLVVQQIIRPTGLLDPTIEIRGSANQVADMEKELDKQIAKKEKTFITVLTIKMAEELAKHLHQKKYKIAYLHNELKTLERDKIINDLRRNRYDAIIGINLLREGLDVPEVSLVMIFDADKPGLFRSEKSLIQTFGRAARNENGRVILYADVKTDAMIKAINETNRRRSIQEAYNIEHNITPKTIIKTVYDDIKSKDDAKAVEAFFHKDAKPKNKTKAIAVLRKAMEQAADSKEYERAAYLRDLIIELEEK